MALIKCKNCGHMISDKALKCPKCGCPIQSTENPSVKQVNVEPLPEKKGNWTKRVLIALLLCLIAGVAYYFINRSSKNTLNNDNSTNTVEVKYTPTDEASATLSPKEVITKSLEELFDNVIKGDIHRYDENYFSSDFNRIYNEVVEIDKRLAEEGYIVFWDFGFWDMAQDDVKMNIVLNDVYDIKENEAMAKVTFKIGSGEYTETKNEEIKVILEDGKWVLDDVHGYKKQMTEYVEENSRNLSSEQVDNSILSNNTEDLKTESVAEVTETREPSVASVSENEDDDEQTIFQVVENQPEFPGGSSALMQYLSKNIKYPKDSQEKGAQGRVIVQFIVNKDGSIVDPVVSRSVEPNLDKEAIRVVSLMPKWKPGMQRGKPVRVRYTLPIAFKLQ